LAVRLEWEGKPKQVERLSLPFQTVETFKVRCDLHPWMSALVRVLPNPFFDVTAGDGIREHPRRDDYCCTTHRHAILDVG